MSILSIHNSAIYNNSIPSNVRVLDLKNVYMLYSDIKLLDNITSLNTHNTSCFKDISDFANLKNLKKLTIKNNHVKNLDMNDLAKTSIVDFTYISFIRFDLGSVYIPLNLTYLSLSNIRIGDLLTTLVSPLITLELKCCEIKTVKGVSRFPDLKLLSLKANTLLELNEEINKLEQLCLLDISLCRGITGIDKLNMKSLYAVVPALSDNDIEKIMLPKLAHIKRAVH
jgi:Leucine-rich repeat (LRR) protein